MLVAGGAVVCNVGNIGDVGKGDIGKGTAGDKV